MKIKSVKLENIRSYVNTKVEFPDNVVLLSGDVGCGKSSILLAIDFALFGFQRGGGEGLLRKGAVGGCVELSLEIDGKDVFIRRVLKRSNDSVVQDAGLISVGGNVENLSITELKAKVLSLLNYPAEMLTRKSLLYRYTVYTPQEEMKMILMGDSQLRLDTLRKVFDIDKYKRVRDNAKFVLSALRLKCKEIEGSLSGYEEDKSRLEELKEKVRTLEEEVANLIVELDGVSEYVRIKKSELDKISQSKEKYNTLVRDRDLVKQQLETKKELLENFRLKLSQIEVVDVSGLNTLEEQYNDFNSKLIEVRKSLSEVSVKRKACNEIKEKISSLDSCPLCKQTVSSEYKSSIVLQQDGLLDEYNLSYDSYISNEQEIVSRLDSLKSELDSLKSRKQEMELNAKQKEELVSVVSSLSSEIDSLSSRYESVVGSLSEMNVEDDASLKEELDKLLEQERGLELDKVSKSKDLEFMKDEVGKLDVLISSKEKDRLVLEKYNGLKAKISGEFVNLMAEIEKKVMLKVYHSFNSLFEKWFKILIEDGLINVRLDDGFSPLIEQNGYSVDYSSLSGGEKTACALAYRLALNQVINNVVSSVKSKDLIILDEPTDGFSSEQLDRMRYVFDELEMGQVIIVSHETKIEGFVDAVIKVVKEGHVSTVS